MNYMVSRLDFNLILLGEALRGRFSFEASMRKRKYLGETFLSKLSGEASMYQSFVRRALIQSWHVWPWVTLYVTASAICCIFLRCQVTLLPPFGFS
jgi:hypothetical protein